MAEYLWESGKFTVAPSGPLAPNCLEYHEDSEGKVDGVLLGVREMPATRYKLVAAVLIPEANATGLHDLRVQVLQADGRDALGVPVYLAYPWRPDLQFDGRLLPGNSSYPFEHIIVNTYEPPEQIGYLCTYVGRGEGEVDSDVLFGLGLPKGHHVRFAVCFQERTVGELPYDDPASDDLDLRLVVAAERIADTLEILAMHLGAFRGDTA